MDVFGENITDWYKINKRDLPWRSTNSAYYIWLSEIILQQTRVEQGMSYYHNFVANYPTVQDLANAPIDDVLRLWQGLGYYSRARNLHFTANQIINDYDGIFPNTYNEISKLKGVGDYTASAIASFAFGEVQPVLDGNVFRVISRYFGVEDDIAKNSSRKIFKEILFKEISQKDPALFNQAIMEFGALQCSPKKTDCDSCPISDSCFALKNDMVDKLPVKSKNIKKRTRYFNYTLLKHKNTFALTKRSEKDIWQGLFEFPMIESTDQIEIESLLNKYQSLGIVKSKVFPPLKKHVLSHQNIFSQMMIIEVEKTEGFDFYTLEEINELPKPILIENFLLDNLY